MPSYRVELSKTSRASCQDAVCKANGDKIMKGELRFGTWLELPGNDFGSWKWKHWGCVSGAQLQKAKEFCMSNGDLDINFLDGYDEIGDRPDLQEKILRCVEQSHIDPEDFKGDPEYNKPGSRGIRGRKKKVVEDEAGSDEDAEASISKSGTADKKSKPAKAKKRGRAEDDDEVADVKPKKAKKAAPVKAEPDSVANEKPKKKGKKPSAKKESFAEDEEGDRPKAKRSRAKKTTGATENGSDDEAVGPATATKGKGKGPKTTTRKAASVKGGDQPTTPKKSGRKRTANPAPSPEPESKEGFEAEEEIEEKPKARRRRGRGRVEKA